MRGVYLVLDPDQTEYRPALEIADAAISGGVSAVQWRQKQGSWRARWSQLKEVQSLCWQAQIPFLVNDRVDVALAIDADGAHVGSDDLPAAEARKLLHGKLLGLSVTREQDLAAALEAEPDYLGIGPIFPTPSKPDAPALVGVEFLRRIRVKTSLPLVAIGGIVAENATQTLTAGADAIAVISAICSAPDPQSATRELVEALKEVPVS